MNQDAFLCSKSSLQNISCQSGCISLFQFIPARHFLQIRMHFSAQNHPSKTFPADQDAFLRPKSSLQNTSCESGCIPPLQNHPCKTFPADQDAFLRSKIISPKHFLQIRMYSAVQNHPCYEMTIVKKRLQEISISRQATFVFL